MNNSIFTFLIYVLNFDVREAANSIGNRFVSYLVAEFLLMLWSASSLNLINVWCRSSTSVSLKSLLSWFQILNTWTLDQKLLTLWFEIIFDLLIQITVLVTWSWNLFAAVTLILIKNCHLIVELYVILVFRFGRPWNLLLNHQIIDFEKVALHWILYHIAWNIALILISKILLFTVILIWILRQNIMTLT